MHRHPLAQVLNIETGKFEWYCSFCRMFFLDEENKNDDLS